MAFDSRTRFRRTLLALCTALLATGMCVARHHVHIDLADTATYASPIQHRCGLLMLACVGWALCEAGLYFRAASPRYVARP